MGFDVKTLTPADVLKRKVGDSEEDVPGGWVVRKIWQQPIIREGQTHLHMTITGFTLMDTASLTDREVSVDELQQAVDDGNVVPFNPLTVRQVKGLTPKGYHKS